MEIFQKIWTALTNENVLLTDIIFIPEVFLEIFVNMLIFTSILNIKSTKSTKIKYVVILSVIVNLSTFFIPNPYCSYINLLAQLTLIYILFKLNVIKTILACILPLLVTVLCESIIAKVLLYFFKLEVDCLVSIPIYRLSIALSVQVFSIFIYMIIKYSKFQIHILENMSKKSKAIFIINLIFAFIALSIQFIITGFYIERLPIYIVLFSNVSLILYFILSIYSLSKTTQLEITSLNLEQEKELLNKKQVYKKLKHLFQQNGLIQFHILQKLKKKWYNIKKYLSISYYKNLIIPYFLEFQFFWKTE